MSVVDELPLQSESSGAASLLAALVIVARYRGIHLSQTQLRRDHRLAPGELSPDQLVHIARANGMRALTTRLSFGDLMRMGAALPTILLLKNGSAMVLLQVERKAQPPHVVVQDPVAGEDALLTLDEQRLALGWVGEVILLKRDYRLRDEDQPFGLRLIAAQVFRDRRIARDIAVAAFVLSILALAPIMFWRLLIDKVLYYHSLDTLAVLCVAMLVLIVFETIFGYMRRFLVLHITARVDAQLSTYMFNKVLNLPLDFFERSSTGVITRDMNEIFKIRSFLTGQVFGTVLDSFVLLVFLPIMFFFSATLTAVVLGFCALICLWIIKMLPVLRRKGAAAFRAEGAKNAFLVENLQGVRTVKSLALDARQRHEWDVRVATAARLRLDEGRTANVIQTLVTPLERLMVSGVFALAVYFAVSSNDQFYIGALVAFMMLTQRVASPLVQLSQLLQQYDEAQFAVKAISALVNQPAEEGRARAGIRTPLQGRIEFEDVRFRYRGSTVPALDGRKAAYMKVTSRTADDWPALGVAVSFAHKDGTIRDPIVVVSAATEKVTRMASAEKALQGVAPDDAALARAGEAAAAEAQILADAHGSAAYKRELLRVYVRRAVRQALLQQALAEGAQ